MLDISVPETVEQFSETFQSLRSDTSLNFRAQELVVMILRSQLVSTQQSSDALKNQSLKGQPQLYSL